jgi:hypothetical protein
MRVHAAGMSPAAPIEPRKHVKSRLWILLAAIVLSLLNACGGSGNNNSVGHLRVINTTGLPLDLATNSADTSPLLTGIAARTASAYVDIAAGTYPFFLFNSGTSVNSTTRSIGSATSYSLVAFTTSGVVTTQQLTEAQGAPSSGNAAFRVYNTSNEAGPVDVYLTASNVDLANAGPTVSNLASSRLSIYGEIAKGTYRVRVTGTGSKTDIRLDLPSVTLNDQQIATLILTSVSGGTLVNAFVDNEQGGTVTSFPNTAARVRLLASASTSNSVSATVNGTALSGGAVASPNLGAYSLITAGALTTTVQIGGAAVTVPSFTAAAGTDNTLVVAGTPAAPTITLIADDNSPDLDTTRAKLRLVDALNGVSGSLSMTVDFGTTLQAAFGAISPSSVSVVGTSATGTTLHQLDIRTPTSALISVPNVNLTAGQAYTVFVAGDAASPQVLVRTPR